MIKNILRRLKINKTPKNRLKQYLSVTQEADLLTILGQFSNEAYCANELWLQSRKSKEFIIKVKEIEPASKFQFTFSMDDLLSKIPETEPDTYDFYLKVRKPLNGESQDTAETVLENRELKKENGVEIAEDLMRLGRFQQTEIQNTEFFTRGEKSGIVYITQKGNLSFVVNTAPKPSLKLQIDKMVNTNREMVLEGKIFTKNSRILSGEGVVNGRNSNTTIKTDVSFIHDNETTQKVFGLNRYKYVLRLDLDRMIAENLLDDDVYDLYVNLNLHDQKEEIMVRVGRPTTRVKLFIKEMNVMDPQLVTVINPYFTFKASNLSLEIYQFPAETFNFMKKKLRWAPLYRLLFKKKDVWLVGERTYKAQDTGFQFFKFMREKHPEKEVYYVIDKSSPEFKNVEPLGNVLDFKSKEHIWHTLISSRIISSHHPDYLFPVRTRKFKKKIKALKVFLQHGVMGTKNMVANYGKNATSGFDTDIFMVSSDFEKEMIVKDFGYSKKNVFVTGLSRFDTLFKEDTEIKRQLLIIPTWRDWITSDEIFLESEYFNRYHNLIHNPKLHLLAKNHNFKIIFCLHPNMQKYTPYFNDAPVKVISQGEVDVQYLLKESAILITDYSSVAFDFSFLEKPVIYYQFDRDRFIGNRPSHLDLDKDLPGDIVSEPDELLSCLHGYIENDFKMHEMYKKRAKKFIKYRDLNSSQRIYDVVRTAKKQENSAKKILGNYVIQTLLKRFRTSKSYFPVMKILYNIMRRVLPVDRNLILFESGIGKQYADSPRYIYEELLRRNSNMKKVWVYNKKLPVEDKQTKVIKRLSPQYYYYLAKSGYWVNNQNFPTYLKKRKNTTYIQTWHGTPLKKMLFDIENIQGRDEGYLSRVHSATRTWDYLISPSAYASKAFKSAFRYNGEILEIGYPRNDLFFREDASEIAKGVYSKLKIPNGKKVILYAPTFRDNQTSTNNKFVFDINFDLEQMKKRLGEDYVLLLRMHVVISNKLHIPEEYRGFVVNVSNYPDIQELYLISDILITDYSSVMFDFANTGRPILYYTYDIDDYRDNIRGFYMDFEQEAPGPFLKSTESIIEAIENIEAVQREYKDVYNGFREKYCGLEDGKAAKRVVDRFFDA